MTDKPQKGDSVSKSDLELQEIEDEEDSISKLTDEHIGCSNNLTQNAI